VQAELLMMRILKFEVTVDHPHKVEMSIVFLRTSNATKNGLILNRMFKIVYFLIP